MCCYDRKKKLHRFWSEKNCIHIVSSSRGICFSSVWNFYLSYNFEKKHIFIFCYFQKKAIVSNIISDQTYTICVFENSWSAICHSPKLSATSLKVLLLVDIVLTLLYFVLLSTFFVMSTDENYEYWIYGKKHVKMQGSCCML